MVKPKTLVKYAKLINFYPPFVGAGVRVKNISASGNRFEVEMKLRWYNRNLYGTHFGGSLYSMCDPFFVFAAFSGFGDGYILWDKSARIEYKRPGKGTVKAVFEITPEELDKMKKIVDEQGKKTFTFHTQVTDRDGQTVAEVEKEIYIKKKS